MKYIKKVFCTLLAAMMVMGCSISVFASEADTQKKTAYHDYLVESLAREAEKPAKNAPVVDLSSDEYDYTVEKLGYRLYTNVWLKGTTSIKVTVTDWKLIESHPGAEKSKLQITVYDEYDQVAAMNTMNIEWDHDGLGHGAMELSGLNAQKKYYVCFGVSPNSNEYSFYGSIKGN